MPRSALLLTAICACGGSAPAPQTARVAAEPALEPSVIGQQWYRALSTCAQGPFELEVPATGAKWGEDIGLQLHAPHKIALEAVVLVDGTEVAHTHGVYDSGGTTGGGADNAKCVADAHERLVLGRAGGPGTPGTPATPGSRVLPPPPPPMPPQATPQLAPDPTPITVSGEIVHFHFPSPAPGAHVKIRFWSVDPNDLVGVMFGIAHVEWRPNVPEAAYEAHLAQRAAAELRRREDEARRVPEIHGDAYVEVHVDPAVEARARAAAQHAREVAIREQEEAARRRAIAVALEAERARMRKLFCDGHHDDRDCWGPGGFAMHSELDLRIKERETYCAANLDDARCWSSMEWSRHCVEWNIRLGVAQAPPKQPDGPPPAPLAETEPPRPSVHAEWRPGYWQWTLATWVWLAGMWRVPDSDIADEQTVKAPAPPPPPTVEAPPPPPVRTAVWIAGFWMWNSTSWVWVPGSWQLRPEARVTWRAPEWRARGSVHVLIPGGWVHR